MSREDMVTKVREAIWDTLEAQAERFGHVDREAGVVDIGDELDMTAVAEAAVDAVAEILQPPF
jgi:hypothetical protein